MVSFSQILFLFTSYLVASIPFGLLISVIFAKKDIREFGSGNIGATNVTRVLGKKLGAATFMLDALKGAIMIMVGKLFFEGSGELFILFIGITTIIGHVFPVYLKFKGGKGVATTCAILIAIDPAIGLFNISMWLIIFYISRISSVSSLLSILTTNISVIYFNYSKEYILFLAFITILIFIRHKDNILKLIKRKEEKF